MSSHGSLFPHRERVKEFYDIRGCKFVHARENSLASNRLVLRMLKQMGEDASFFSDIQGLAYSASFIARRFCSYVQIISHGFCFPTSLTTVMDFTTSLRYLQLQVHVFTVLDFTFPFQVLKTLQTST